MDIVDIIRAKLGRFPLVKRILTPFNLMICEYRRKKRYKVFQIHRDSLFKKIINVFKEENLRCWVEFGTLLGIYRDHGFIPGDDDFDFGAFIDDAEHIKRAMIERGYTLLKDYEAENNPTIKEMTFKSSEGITFDVFFFTKEENCYSCYIFALTDVNIREKTKRYKVKKYDFPVFEFETIDFMGEKVCIPSPVTSHLEYSYGKSFMIPDPHFNSLHFNFMDNVFAIDKQEKKIF